MSDDFDPSKPGLAHQEMSPRWKIMRDVMGGTETMREATEEYLPKDKNESTDNYDRRVKSTFLHNKTEDAVRTAVAKPFSKEVHVSDDTDPDLIALCEDIDLQGNNITVFAQNLAEEAFSAGLVHFVVDYPSVDPSTVQTLLDERQIAARPYFAMVKAEDLLYASIVRVNGRPVVAEARYRETVTEMDEETGEEIEIEQVRQWLPGQQVIWRKADDEWTSTAIPLPQFSQVALVTIYAGRKIKDFVVKPLFLDLAYKNIEHWQSSSEQRVILRYSRFPIPYVAGIDPATLQDDEGEPVMTFGPEHMWVIPDPSGRAGYLEPNGSSIQLGFTDLDKIERHMAELSMKPHMPDRTGTVTATFHAIESVSNHSAVQKVCLNLSDALEQGMMFAAAWLGKSGDVNVGISVNTDFSPTASDNDEFDRVLEMQGQGILSRRTTWEEAKRRDILSPTFDADEEAALLISENAEFGDQGNVTDPNADTDITDPALDAGVPQ